MKTFLAITIQVLLLMATLTILAFLRFSPLINILVVVFFELPIGNWISTKITGIDVYKRYFN